MIPANLLSVRPDFDTCSAHELEFTRYINGLQVFAKTPMYAGLRRRTEAVEFC